MFFTHYYYSSRVHISRSRSLISARLVWFGSFRAAAYLPSAPAARAGRVVNVDQAAALLRCCCSLLELLWVFCGCPDVGLRREGPVVQGAAAAAAARVSTAAVNADSSREQAEEVDVEVQAEVEVQFQVKVQV